MKRIEAMVPSMRRRVVESILQAGAKGVTLVEGRGKGDGERPMVKGPEVLQNTLQIITELTP